MPAPSDRWIEIPRWAEFQHYRDRNPVWIREYVRQVRDDDYVSLELGARGLLHDLRLLYAENGGPLRESYARTRLGAPLGVAGQALGNHSRAFRRHLAALNHAGFVEVLASKPLSPETDTETEDIRALALESLGTTPNPAPPTAPANPDRPRTAYGYEGALLDLLRGLHDRDNGTERVIRGLLRKHQLGEGAIRTAIDASRGARKPAAAAVAELKRQAALRTGGPTWRVTA